MDYTATMTDTKDLREEILVAESNKVIQAKEITNARWFREDIVKEAMDSYFTKRSMELLEYMRKNVTRIEGAHEDAFLIKDEWLTAKELFENSL